MPGVRCLRPGLVADEADGVEVRQRAHAQVGDRGLPLHQGDGRGHDGHGRANRRARPDVRREDLFVRQQDPGHGDRQLAGEPVDLALGHVRLPLHDHPRDLRLLARRRGAGGVHESVHLHGPGRRQPLLLGRRERDLGHRFDPRRPHVDGRRDRPVGASLGRRHTARAGRRGRRWAASSDVVGVAGYDVSRDGVVIGSARSGPTPPSPTRLRPRPRPTSTRCAHAMPPAMPRATPRPPRRRHRAPCCRSRTASRQGSPAGRLPAASRCRGRRCTAAARGQGNTTNGATYAKKTVTATRDGYARVWFNLKSEASQVNLLRMRATGSVSLGYAFVTATGQLGMRNDVTATTTTSGLVPGPGWHSLELHFLTNDSASVSEVWLDGTKVTDLSSALTDSAPRRSPVPDRRGPDRAHLRRGLRRRGLRDAAPRAVKVWSRALTHAPVAPDELLGRVDDRSLLRSEYERPRFRSKGLSPAAAPAIEMSETRGARCHRLLAAIGFRLCISKYRPFRLAPNLLIDT